MATLNIDMNNPQGVGTLADVALNEGLLPPSFQILKNNASNGEVQKTIVVPAAQPLYLSYHVDKIPYVNKYCLAQVSFVPAADETDFLFVGDIPPTPGGFWARIVEWPEFGAKCYVRVLKQLPDGKLQPVELMPWKFFILGDGST